MKHREIYKNVVYFACSMSDAIEMMFLSVVVIVAKVVAVKASNR